MHIIIAGAGITGLSAAISLRRCGHKVTIYERSLLDNEVGAALNVPPNVIRFLVPWGLDPVKLGFVRATGLRFLSPTSLESLNLIDQTNYEELFGAPLYYAHRVDLHEGLKKLALEPEGSGIPVKIIPNSEISHYDPDTPSITLKDGPSIPADLVIAADGVHSVGPSLILGHENPPYPANSYNCCYRFLIPSSVVESDPNTKFFVNDAVKTEVKIWADNESRRRLVSYRCRNMEMLNFVALCYDENMQLKKENWHASVDKAELLEKYKDFHPGILAVMEKATDIKRWPLLYRAPIPAFYTGQLALAGDAAHPMLPNHAQGAAQGMEDGVALGLVMYGVTDRSQIKERLSIYDNIRRRRASSIQILSNFGYDQAVSDELVQYLEGAPVPQTPRDMMDLAVLPDIVKRTTEEMLAINPSYSIPPEFFSS